MATKTGKTVVAVAPVAADVDLTFAQEVGHAVVDFIKRGVAFFAKANELEQTAVALRSAADEWRRPGANGTQASDVRVQEFIRTCSAQAKVIEEHWTITTKVHQLHKRLVARRDRGVKLLKEASDIGNAVHNEYTAAERQRALAEQRRLQAIEDERAAARRRAELEDLEQAAIRLEAQCPKLSDREGIFIYNYLRHNNPVTAAKQAGYLQPESRALLLLQTPKIADEIERRRSAEALRQQASVVAAEPVQVTRVEVAPAIAKATGASERTTWKAEVFDDRALIAAVFAGTVPQDCLTVDYVKLNQYARDLHDAINQWPGVRAVSKTGVV